LSPHSVHAWAKTNLFVSTLPAFNHWLCVSFLSVLCSMFFSSPPPSGRSPKPVVNPFKRVGGSRGLYFEGGEGKTLGWGAEGMDTYTLVGRWMGAKHRSVSSHKDTGGTNKRGRLGPLFLSLFSLKNLLTFAILLGGLCQGTNATDKTKGRGQNITAPETYQPAMGQTD
jgi:hypothetical protein